MDVSYRRSIFDWLNPEKHQHLVTWEELDVPGKKPGAATHFWCDECNEGVNVLAPTNYFDNLSAYQLKNNPPSWWHPEK